MKTKIQEAVQSFKDQGINEMTMSRILERAGINTPRSEAEVHMLIEALEDLESEGVLQDLSTSNKGWGITSGAKGDISLSVGFKVGF